MKKKQLTISLIKDFLVFVKLTNGLAKIGWDADEYYQELPQTIFKLMGFSKGNRSLEALDKFLNGVDRIDEIDIKTHRHLLDLLAETMYLELQISKVEIKEQKLIDKIMSQFSNKKKKLKP